MESIRWREREGQLWKNSSVESRGGHEASVEVVVGVDVSPVGVRFPTAVLLNDRVRDTSELECSGATTAEGVTCVRHRVTTW